MRLMTNPGSNLSQEQLERYRITMLPQRILVDGHEHDTRTTFPLAQIDDWLAKAERWPTTIGTTATETVAAFQEAVRAGEREIVLITTSRKMINSYDAAEVAKATFGASTQGKGVRIALVDSGVTDVGAGMLCVLAGEAIEAGLSFEQVVALLTDAAREMRMAVSLSTLDNVVKGGRASSLRRFFAELLGVRPILGLIDGELQSVGTYRIRNDAFDKLTAWLSEEIKPGRKVWLGLFHTGDPDPVLHFSHRIAGIYDVSAQWVRTLAPGVYVHCGPGAMGVALFPVDTLRWTPRVSPTR